MARILIVDDERSIRNTLREILSFEKYEIEEAEDGMACLAKVKQQSFDVILLDIKMPHMDGQETLARLLEMRVTAPIIMISGHANMDTAVEAVKQGAYDFLSKPPDLNRLLTTIKRSLEERTSAPQASNQKSRLTRCTEKTMVGTSDAISHIRNTISRVAPTEARVLITGPNGTGKELVAHQIHRDSTRAKHPLIEVNCAAIPSELIESELFGHEKGAFTSAIKKRIGKFQMANGGTLFLDEIGDMSLSAQAKVLRALEQKTIVPVGGEKQIKVDVRVIAATNKDLLHEIRMGRFREDLYHRLAVIIVHVPSLSQRLEDIPDLVDYFASCIEQDTGMMVPQFQKNAIKALQEHEWTGNVRELRNVVERLTILCEKKVSDKDVQQYVYPQQRRRSRLADLLDEFDRLEDVQNYLSKQWHEHKLG